MLLLRLQHTLAIDAFPSGHGAGRRAIFLPLSSTELPATWASDADNRHRDRQRRPGFRSQLHTAAAFLSPYPLAVQVGSTLACRTSALRANCGHSSSTRQTSCYGRQRTGSFWRPKNNSGRSTVAMSEVDPELPFKPPSRNVLIGWNFAIWAVSRKQAGSATSEQTAVKKSPAISQPMAPKQGIDRSVKAQRSMSDRLSGFFSPNVRSRPDSRSTRWLFMRSDASFASCFSIASTSA